MNRNRNNPVKIIPWNCFRQRCVKIWTWFFLEIFFSKLNILHGFSHQRMRFYEYDLNYDSLDAFSHLYKRVCLSVRRSVGPSHTSWISEKWDFWTEFEQNSITGTSYCTIWKTIKRQVRYVAGRRNASYVWSLNSFRLV